MLTWNPNAVTFADESLVGTAPPTLFVNTDNIVYVVDKRNYRVQVWNEGSGSPTKSKFNDLREPHSIFVTIPGDIYVSVCGYFRVEKLPFGATASTTVMNGVECCYGLFVDINDNIYCSINSQHKVVKKSLSNGADSPKTVAGTGSQEPSSNMIDRPYGIFVDTNFDLYVADFGNDRIQLFVPGEVNGKTLVGTGGKDPFKLTYPTAVVLDADKYLFIAERYPIIGSGPNGFRCLVGCSSSSSPFALDKLDRPMTLSFDSYGNIFVTDSDHNRIQKFDLSKNSCGNPRKHFLQKTASNLGIPNCGFGWY